MKTGRIVKCVMLSIATLGLCFPQVVLAANQTPAPPVVDVAMTDGGVLQGRVVDLQGGGVAGVPVSVKTQNKELAQTTTTEDGHFTVNGLRDGVYQLAAGEGQGVYRIWAAKTAPPAAQKNAIVYTQGGYGGCGGLKMFLSNPIVIAGLVATAIAVPVALANSGSSSP
ncbi:MAG: carboxypeptidase regulatory-like domain-containing protein [Pirellulaceae bacterium]|nr:carboxypeptidase regulatory-like domain-containing protein [Pirellulaceae bacterium]